MTAEPASNRYRRVGAACLVLRGLVLRGPREVDDPAGDVDGVVAKTLVERATSVIFVVTGSAIRAEASSALRLACNSSISSSRASRASAATGRAGTGSTAWRHISDARFPIRSTIPRVLGERSSPRMWLDREAICTMRSWERSSSGTIRSTERRKRRSEATGASAGFPG